jgi:hypothetical protein
MYRTQYRNYIYLIGLVYVGIILTPEIYESVDSVLSILRALSFTLMYVCLYLWRIRLVTLIALLFPLINLNIELLFDNHLTNTGLMISGMETIRFCSTVLAFVGIIISVMNQFDKGPLSKEYELPTYKLLLGVSSLIVIPQVIFRII